MIELPSTRYYGSKRRVAEKIYNRHVILKEFLIRLGVSEETAESDACKIEHHISDESFAAIDKIYRPYMDSLEQGLFLYKEFASLSLIQKSKPQGELLQSYLQQIPADSPFYGNFIASFTGYFTNEYFYPADELCKQLPSFFKEHCEGHISDSEYEKLYTEYNKLANSLR